MDRSWRRNRVDGSPPDGAEPIASSQAAAHGRPAKAQRGQEIVISAALFNRHFPPLPTFLAQETMTRARKRNVGQRNEDEEIIPAPA
jgi:hypothetical protein